VEKSAGNEIVKTKVKVEREKNLKSEEGINRL